MIIDQFSDDSTLLNVSTCTPSEKSMSAECSRNLISQPKSVTMSRRNLLVPPPDQSATHKIQKHHKEQEQLSKMIGNTTEALNTLVHNFVEKRHTKPINDDNEDTAMAKALIYALKRVDSKYKIELCRVLIYFG